jgi:hypothetical protein
MATFDVELNVAAGDEIVTALVRAILIHLRVLSASSSHFLWSEL